MESRYSELHARGILNERIAALRDILRCCTLCPRKCGVDRLAGEKGYCNAPGEMLISSAFPHYGEEAPLVGIGGSGTIFLGFCNLLCIFCQNYDISHLGGGSIATAEQVAKMMLVLQELGCHNINFVTPTHYTPHLVEALAKAVDLGVTLPIVYNCGGYESPETLKLLEGIIDIYMPDTKFSGASWAKRFCDAEDYFAVNKAALREMFRQVGDLQVDARGIAVRGLLVRHLVLPNDVAGSEKMLRFISDHISRNTYVNIMAQYRPCYRAVQFPEIARRPRTEEFEEVVRIARELGLTRGLSQW